MLIILEGPAPERPAELFPQLAEYLEGRALRLFDNWFAGPLERYELPLLDYRPGRYDHVICDWESGSLDGPAQLHVHLFWQARGALVIRSDEPPYQPKMIVRRADSYEQNATRLNDISPLYVGPIWPQYLLVGDRCGTTHPRLGAFAPFPNTSGHYLLTVLHRLTLVRRPFGLVNAYDDGSTPDDLWDWWRALRQPRTVALGQRAHDALTEARIPHGSVPHPQYVRRFHYHAGIEYGDVIASALDSAADLREWRP